jgi:hypothetical protein
MAGLSYPINLGLGDVPDTNITPEVWQELNKLSLACKHIAGAMGLSAGSSGSYDLGIGNTVTIQDYARVKRTVPYSMPAGSVVEFGNTDTQLVSSAYPYPTAFLQEAAATNTVAEFIMLGMVWYAPGGLVPGTKYYANNGVPGTISASVLGRYIGQAFTPNVLYFDPVRS